MPIITPVKDVVSVLGVNIAPDNGLYGEAPPKRGIFSGFSYINEQGNLSLQSVKGPKRAKNRSIYGCIKTRKLSGLVIYSTVFVQQLKRCSALHPRVVS